LCDRECLEIPRDLLRVCASVLLVLPLWRTGQKAYRSRSRPCLMRDRPYPGGRGALRWTAAWLLVWQQVPARPGHEWPRSETNGQALPRPGC
jgi:hypothetical protein